MASVEAILNHRRIQLEKSVKTLTHVLADYAEDDPHAEGERTLLEAQQQYLALVEECLTQASDTKNLSVTIHAHLIAAHEAHRLAAEHDHFSPPAPPGSHSDAWWMTLSKKDFLSTLLIDIKYADDIPHSAVKHT